MNSAIRDIVHLLETRGELYIQPYSYDTVVAYLLGFDSAMTACGHESYLPMFDSWLNRRVGHNCSLHWKAVVRDIFAEGDSCKAVKTLFDLFKQFDDET